MSLLLSGCSRSPEDAKKELSDKKIQYNEQNFVKAIEEENVDVVELFIEGGMSPNVTTANGSPLPTAAAIGNLEIVKLLVEKGADVNIKSKDKGDLTPLFAAILGNGKEKQDTIKLLLEKGADVNARFISKGFEATPLMMAAAQKDTEIVRLILAKKPDIHAVDAGTGITALMMAVLNNNVENAKELLAQGADVNKKAKNNVTALSLAKQENNKEMVSVLTNAGAK
ncbi:ankyrin repeat domain-containing protein [Pelosinus sp. sgz500959]|uniref:ankyrin repeat domain-containing protein n=1 Tax=Pelosinus sp. sgz500959 TaxID=3242472 RepID=UPI00366A7544